MSATAKGALWAGSEAHAFGWGGVAAKRVRVRSRFFWRLW